MQTALQVGCPRCAAYAGKPCLSEEGRPLSEFHRERIDSATKKNVQKLRPDEADEFPSQQRRSQGRS
jgi:hypothetical protein